MHAPECWLPIPDIWRGHSSVGRAPALQAGGRRFDSVWLHQLKLRSQRTSCAAAASASLAVESAIFDIVKRKDRSEIRSRHTSRDRCAISEHRQHDRLAGNSPARGGLVDDALPALLDRTPSERSEASWSFYSMSDDRFVRLNARLAPLPSGMGIDDESDQVT